MFDDLHDPEPPAPGQDTPAKVRDRARSLRRRRRIAATAAGASVLAALAVVVIEMPGRDRDRVTPAVETAVTTGSVATTTAATTATTTATTTASSAPAETIADGTISPTPPPSVPDSCFDAPSAPLWLLDGSSPGDGRVEERGGETVYRWGDGSPQVRQVRATTFDDPFAWTTGDQLAVSGDVRIAVVPVGDGAVGEIIVAVDDGACERQYSIGPGVTVADAIGYANHWAEGLAFWRSAAIDVTSDGVCVRAAEFELEMCLLADEVDSSIQEVGADLGLIVAIAPIGSTLSPASSRAFTADVPGTDDMAIVELFRRNVCVEVSHPGVTPSCGTPQSAGLRLVAVDGFGDVVLVDGSGSRTLFDGTDPDDPAPTEGERVLVDGMSLSPDGSTVVVRDCCEPVPGNLVAIDVATGAQTFVGFGHLPAFTSAGDLVWGTLGSAQSTDLNPVVVVGDVQGEVGATLHEFPLDSRIDDLAVVPGPESEQVVVLLATPTGTELWTFPVAGGDMQRSAEVSDVPWTEPSGLSLAGWSRDSYFVLDDGGDRLLAFDQRSLEPVPVPDSRNTAISAWYSDSVVAWVTDGGELWANDSVWRPDVLRVR